MQSFREPVGDGLVERLLLLETAALVPGDLDHDEVVRALDAEIARIIEKAVALVLADDLEPVLLRYADRDKRLIDDAADFLPISGVLALTNVDPDERHDPFSYCFELKR